MGLGWRMMEWMRCLVMTMTRSCPEEHLSRRRMHKIPPKLNHSFIFQNLSGHRATFDEHDHNE